MWAAVAKPEPVDLPATQYRVTRMGRRNGPRFAELFAEPRPFQMLSLDALQRVDGGAHWGRTLVYVRWHVCLC